MCTIAVYERDDLMHSLLGEWLTGAGYSVHIGASGLATGARGLPAAPVDLVIIGIAGAGRGEGAIRLVRSWHPGAPIIALSSQARSGLSSQGSAARALGVERLMAVPLVRGELLAAVRSIIGPPRVIATTDPRPNHPKGRQEI